MKNFIKGSVLILSFARLTAMDSMPGFQLAAVARVPFLTADEVSDIASDMESMHLMHTGLLTWKLRAKGNEELLKDIEPMYQPKGPSPLHYYFETMKHWHEIYKKWNFDTSKIVIPEGYISKSQERVLRELFKNN